MRTFLYVTGVMLVCGAAIAVADGSCMYQDRAYLNGSDSCQAGTRYVCENGVWQASEAPCSLQAALTEAGCEFGGQAFASGRIACASGTQQRCDHGRWDTLGTPCDGEVVPFSGFTRVSVPQRGCDYSRARFQPQAMMCQDGMTFICENGAWTNLRTPCE